MGDIAFEDDQEEMQERLQSLLDHATNKICADCPERHPDLISLLQQPLVEHGNNLGVFCCAKCSRVHRSLGEDICIVKRIYDDFTLEEVQTLEQSGNQFVNNILQASATEADIAEEREAFIPKKYKGKLFYSEDKLYQQSAVRAKSNKYAMLLVKPGASASRADRLLKRQSSNPNLMEEEGNLRKSASSGNIMGKEHSSSNNLTGNRASSSRNLMGSRAGSSRNLMGSRAGSRRNLMVGNGSAHGNGGLSPKRQRPKVTSIDKELDTTEQSRGRMPMGRVGSKRDLMAGSKSGSRRNILAANRASSRRNLLSTGNRAQSRPDMLTSSKSLSKSPSKGDLRKSGKPLLSPDLAASGSKSNASWGVVKKNLLDGKSRGSLLLSYANANCDSSDDEHIPSRKVPDRAKSTNKQNLRPPGKPSSSPDLAALGSKSNASWALVKSNLRSGKSRGSLLLSYANADSDSSEDEDEPPRKILEKAKSTSKGNLRNPGKSGKPSSSPDLAALGSKSNASWGLVKSNLLNGTSRGSLLLSYANADSESSEDEDEPSRKLPENAKSTSKGNLRNPGKSGKPSSSPDLAALSSKPNASWGHVKTNLLNGEKRGVLLLSHANTKPDSSDDEDKPSRKVPDRAKSTGNLLAQKNDKPAARKVSAKWDLLKSSLNSKDKTRSLLLAYSNDDDIDIDSDSDPEDCTPKKKTPLRSSSSILMEMKDKKGSSRPSKSSSKGDLARGSNHLSRFSPKGEMTRGSNHLSGSSSKGDLSKGSKHLSRSPSKEDLSKGSKHLSRCSSAEYDHGVKHSRLSSSNDDGQQESERYSTRPPLTNDPRDWAEENRKGPRSRSTSKGSIIDGNKMEKGGGLPPKAEASPTVVPLSIKDRIREVCERSGNQVCSECTNTNPAWASFFTSPVDGRRVGVLCCYSCYGLHLKVGVGEMTLKSVKDADQWLESDFEALALSGNALINASYEAGAQQAKEDQHNESQGREAYFFEKYINLQYFNPEIYQTMSAQLMLHAKATSMQQQALDRRQQQQFSTETDRVEHATSTNRSSSPGRKHFDGHDEDAERKITGRSANEREGGRASNRRETVERGDEKGKKKKSPKRKEKDEAEEKRKKQAIMELKAARKYLEQQEERDANDGDEIRTKSSSPKPERERKVPSRKPSSKRSSSRRNLMDHDAIDNDEACRRTSRNRSRSRGRNNSSPKRGISRSSSKRGLY